MTTTIDIKATKKELAELRNHVEHCHGSIAITEAGKLVMALVPVSSPEVLEQIERLLDLEAARRALKESEEKGTYTVEQVAANLGFTMEQVAAAVEARKLKATKATR